MKALAQVVLRWLIAMLAIGFGWAALHISTPGIPKVSILGIVGIGAVVRGAAYLIGDLINPSE